jgi:uncharacterized protein (TIGR03067 family)
MQSHTSQLVPYGYAPALSIALLALHGFALITSAQDSANTAQVKKDAVDEKAIQKRIAELGDESFNKRETAYKRLATLGMAAQPALEKASRESTDVEVRQRAHRLIAQLSLNALSALNGAWSVVSIEVGGKKMVLGNGSPDKIVIERGKMTIFVLGKPFAIFQDRVLKINPIMTPKTIDIVIAERGFTVPGIYELNGTELRLVIPRAPATSDMPLERPRSFETRDSPVMVFLAKKAAG